MTRILLVGDIHAMDRPPASMNEGYLDGLIDMLNYVADLETSLAADAVVWAGDIFNHKQPARTSHSTVQRMIEVVQRHKNLWIVVGNHDISNDRLDSVLDKQPLGVLLRAGAHELNGWHPELPLFGVPWQQRWHHAGVVEEAFKDWREAANSDKDLSHALAVTHAPIYPPAQAKDVPFELVPTEEIAAAMGGTGYLYYGHIHEDHGVFEDGGVTFANVGAVSRGSLHEYNLEREVQLAVWQDFPNASYQRAIKAGKERPEASFDQGFTPLVIPHRPADEIFRIAEAQEKKDEKMSLDAFLSDVGSSTLSISSTESVVEHIRGLDVEARVKATAIEILQEIG
jgi:DNA repair exonuclease SbcCD nuclease subunit